MNYLAHAFFAAPDPAAIAGSLIADFARGLDLATLPMGVRDGVIEHRRVDAFTDDHPIVRASRARFEPPLRRFSGIVLDVLFDHFLAMGFHRYSDEPLTAFTASVYAALDSHVEHLPPRLLQVRGSMVQHDWLASYADPRSVERALEGISKRMRHANPLADRSSFEAIRARQDDLQRDFDAFFPTLLAIRGR